MKVLVIGAGIGGLSAALRLAHAGFDVEILEARADAGGLAGSIERGDVAFDAGPYILLDRPGLEWAFEQLGLDINVLDLQRVGEVVYEVTRDDAPPLRIYADLDRTAEEIGPAYREFVDYVKRMYDRLAPMLRIPHPNPVALARAGALGAAPFLLRSLGSVMRRSGLSQRAIEALTIWTHVAGQSIDQAPSPMAFVPALIHFAGAWRPRGGTSAVSRALADAARLAGVAVRFGRTVASINTREGRVIGVTDANSQFTAADAVVSNHSGVGTYVNLVDRVPERTRQRVASLPLQSPGACAYMVARYAAPLPYLRFRLGGDLRCRLLVTPDTGAARLILPLRHGEPRAEEMLERALEETWWREGIASYDVVARRVPSQWGADYHLYRESMNPAMTAKLMRGGRIPHRSREIRGLYLAGSSTHPGQWISFCAISGVLAAEAVIEDAR